MANNWSANPINTDNINNGFEYENGDGVDAGAVNAAVEASLYAQNQSNQAVEDSTSALNYVDALTDPPDLSEVANVGTPSVSFVTNGNYKKFKFSNLKGEQGEKGATGASISDINFIYDSETSTETIYNVQTVLADGTIVDSGQITIPKAVVPVISEFAQEGQVTPSDELMIGGFFFKEVS